MEARRNKIAQRVAQFSDQEIAAAYQNIVDWKNTGVLCDGPCKLEEIACAIQEEMGWQQTDYRKTEDAILIEAGRRFFNVIVEKKAEFSNMQGTGDQKNEPLTIEDLLKMEGEPVYICATWSYGFDFKGWAIIDRLHPDGFFMQFNGSYHFLLNQWYGEEKSPDDVMQWIAYRDKLDGV